MTNHKKVYYSSTITTDNGKTLEFSGWYYKDFPTIGEQKVIDISECFADMA